MENFYEYYCFNIIVNINSFSQLNITMNTTLKYNRRQTLNKKLKLMRECMKSFWKKLLDHEILSSMVPWATNFFLFRKI